ncbi:MAG: 4-hydroxyphenylpyruvate dioxygenase [Candidatus Eisenbacteria bacterium]|nr:4-hydroxyphenylpyruvate dioxygenase [Candidatus Eisenbacteria bacterium]MCC7142799.1 4-hydroxyphenylpyruvate dioxygenase [Candidatus Eisenbacteria bacterium]
MFQGIDHIEFYVGNALATAYFYTNALGFRPLAESGLETGARDRQSFVVTQGEIRLVFTNALDPQSPIADSVRLHGDAIHDIAIQVDDVDRAFQHCLEQGARAIAGPATSEDADGVVRRATIATFGDTVHSLVQRNEYRGPFLPGYRPRSGRAGAPIEERGHLCAVDHIACCVDRGTLTDWVGFYQRVFGFSEVHHEDVVTERSAMNSRVVGSANGRIKVPLMEPAPARGRSQIEEFLDYHHGGGAQHLAFLSEDIRAAVRALQAGGLEFLETPATYYDTLAARVGTIDESFADLAALNILADRDRWGYLLQVFTRPVTGRPTAFLEVVQRHGARGFGGGNVRALFEAVERAQAARGNL